jgi:pimeloyl-ACP methyl ester carboxylesterase
MMAALDESTARRFLTEQGIPVAQAAEAARHIDSGMKDCILRLYRSATNVFAEWEPGLRHIRAPGLVLWGVSDPFAGPGFAERMGEQTGARRVVCLPGCGHWWQCQRPRETAAALSQHWADL